MRQKRSDLGGPALEPLTKWAWNPSLSSTILCMIGRINANDSMRSPELHLFAARCRKSEIDFGSFVRIGCHSRDFGRVGIAGLKRELITDCWANVSSPRKRGI